MGTMGPHSAEPPLPFLSPPCKVTRAVELFGETIESLLLKYGAAVTGTGPEGILGPRGL